MRRCGDVAAIGWPRRVPPDLAARCRLPAQSGLLKNLAATSHEADRANSSNITEQPISNGEPQDVQLNSKHLRAAQNSSIIAKLGMAASRIVIEHKISDDTIYRFPESACLACLTEAGQIVLVRQFRYVHDAETTELPGGKIMDGETAAHAATREFNEETGLEASRPKHLFSLDMDLSVSIHKTHVFVARTDIPHLIPSRVVLFTRTAALENIHSGTITHAPTVAAIGHLAFSIENFSKL